MNLKKGHPDYKCPQESEHSDPRRSRTQIGPNTGSSSADEVSKSLTQQGAKSAKLVDYRHVGGERGEAEGAEAQEGLDPPRTGGPLRRGLQHDLKTRERQDGCASPHDPQAGRGTKGGARGASQDG